MATTTTRRPTTAPLAVAPRRFVRELPRPADAFAHIGPNWFASVMGTGIVANAAVLLPVRVPGLPTFAAAVWTLAAIWLVALTAITAVHWIRHPANARAHASDPAMAPFYGAPPMALMTVGAGALLAGHAVIGMPTAIVVAFVLWALGTVGGLASSVLVPYWLFTRHPVRVEHTFATWLMPVVPPMVSAATGAALIPHLPAGQAREAMLLACYAMFGLSLLASLVIITLVWGRLAYEKTGPVGTAPTLFIVLGPLGQSITAANLLGDQAHRAIAAPFAPVFRAMGVVYGAPVWGFAMLWLVVAGALVARAARRDMGFSLTWWSFTFPVGTVVTGTSLLATSSGLDALAWIAVALYLLLLAAWVMAATRTAHGALRSGRLLQAA